jgi:hypothetical protein
VSSWIEGWDRLHWLARYDDGSVHGLRQNGMDMSVGNLAPLHESILDFIMCLLLVLIARQLVS